MRPVDNETRITMNTRRNFVNYATMTLSDGTILNLTPSDFRIAGNSFTDDMVDGSDFQIGTAIGKTATLLLDNTDGRTEIVGSSTVTYKHGKFSEYDFYLARFQLYVCLPNAYHVGSSIANQMISIGTFTVTTPTSRGATIEITGVDDMFKFDKSFDDCDMDFSLNPTLMNILIKCCGDCGVAIGFASGFDNQNLTVNKRPENVTYRQVVSYIATIAGCNAKIDTTGALTLVSYDMSPLSGLDDGSFTAINEEFQYLDTITWTGSSEFWGQNIEYSSSRIKRSGRYKLTRINVSNVADPTNFDANVEIDSFNSLIGSSTNRFNKIVELNQPLTIGDNILNWEFDISTLNKKVYWFGVHGNNYGDPDASKFDFTIYLEPVSFADGDSADGGTFEGEFQYYDAVHWMLPTSPTSVTYWWYAKNILYTQIHPAGKYTITKVYIDNIVDPSHFNADYIVQKSVDSGSTWTDEQTGILVAGDNIINFDIDIPENVVTRYRVLCRQNIVIDPSASEFNATFYMKANDTVYLDGDNFDGGNFTTPLDFHNLIATIGTSISTDDIQITGVEVKSESNSAHKPNTTGWDNYAIIVEDNPFVTGYESTIAQTIYDKIGNLKFRPFTLSSIQDPTIEAGDCCVVYDVKGNMYNSIITNVVFKTGGYTELSCNAEPPSRQGSVYSAPASVVKVANEMNTYQSQTAHFNEIASAALGYFKTEQVDSQTGATITYLHDQPTLASSTNIVKIANGIVAISDDGGTTYNKGFDVSTGTMLLNLIYVHGLTSDWINTGELTVGGVDNIDGVIHVVNEQLYGNGEWSGAGHEGGDWWKIFNFGYTWLKPAGTYKLTKIVVDDVADPTTFDELDYQYDIKVSSDGGSTWTKVATGKLYAGETIVNYVMNITETDDLKYQLWVGKFNIVATDPTFSYHPYTTSVNTIIDKDGVEIKKGNIKLGPYNSGTSHYAFEATDNGEIYATIGKIAGYDIASSGDTEGFSYITSDYFCQYSKYKIHIGGLWGTHDDGYWTFFGVANKGDFMHLDYGGSGSGGIWITKNGANDMYDFSGSENHIYADGFYINQDIDGTHSNLFYTNFEHSEARVNLSAWVVARIMVYSTGTSMGYYYSYLGPSSVSDIREKENIHEFTSEQLEKFFEKLSPSYFNFKKNKDKVVRYGIIAQNLEEALDYAELDRGVIVQEEDGIKNVVYNELIGISLGGVKDLYKKIDEQQAEINDLKERIKALEDIVNAKLK